jgi:hypothetical protein
LGFTLEATANLWHSPCLFISQLSSVSALASRFLSHSDDSNPRSGNAGCCRERKILDNLQSRPRIWLLALDRICLAGSVCVPLRLFHRRLHGECVARHRAGLGASPLQEGGWVVMPAVLDCRRTPLRRWAMWQHVGCTTPQGHHHRHTSCRMKLHVAAPVQVLVELIKRSGPQV